MTSAKPTPVKIVAHAATLARTALASTPATPATLAALAHVAETSDTATHLVLKMRTRDQQNETAAGVAAGAPFGVVVVWMLNAFALPAPMPGEIAATIGAAVTTLAALAYRAVVRRIES